MPFINNTPKSLKFDMGNLKVSQISQKKRNFLQVMEVKEETPEEAAQMADSGGEMVEPAPEQPEQPEEESFRVVEKWQPLNVEVVFLLILCHVSLLSSIIFHIL